MSIIYIKNKKQMKIYFSVTNDFLTGKLSDSKPTLARTVWRFMPLTGQFEKLHDGRPIVSLLWHVISTPISAAAASLHEPHWTRNNHFPVSYAAHLPWCPPLAVSRWAIFKDKGAGSRQCIAIHHRYLHTARVAPHPLWRQRWEFLGALVERLGRDKFSSGRERKTNFLVKK